MNYIKNTEKPAKGAVPMDCHMPKNNHNPEISDNDDPVVHEIPVFLAQSLAKQLFLYQVSDLMVCHT